MSLVQRIRKAKKILLIGNGGSYANAVHIANDLLSVGKAAFTLDPATLTATANDFGYHLVFEKWVKCVIRRGDLLIALSGSGKSPNVLRAIRAAKKLGADTELITWHLKDGMDMQMSEEAQLVLGHHWMKKLGRR